MNCERCQRDRTVEKYVIDGFEGYLCEECRDQWEKMVDSNTDASFTVSR